MKKIPSQRHSRNIGAGFTLLEILISTAIFAFLTAIVYVGFNQERDRSSVQRAAEQLQVDIQQMQNNAMSGIVLPTGDTASAYGIHIDRTSPYTNYTLYAVKKVDGTNVELKQTSVAAMGDNIIARIDTTPPSVVDSLDLAFAVPTGAVTATIVPAVTPPPSNVSIRLKNTKLNICYAVDVHPAVGTVIQRQFKSCL